MNKEMLKSEYGHYCDTDNLVSDMMALLSKYYHRNTEHGVCTMLDEFFRNKKDLIERFISSENYIGDLRICVDIELARDINGNDIYYFCNHFSKNVDAEKAILVYKDEDGKTLNDYLRTGKTHLKAKDLMNTEIMSCLTQISEKRNTFVIEGGQTKASEAKYRNFSEIMDAFAYCRSQELGCDTKESIESYNIKGKFAPTMKTSRAFNKVCAYYGVDKLPKYNKLFAQYSDMVNTNKRKLKFFISLNPLDYLTMSFGVNWSSCQTIDKRNRRGMQNGYQGAYCGGTLSYMLDSTSFITYVHTDMPESVEDGKIYRCMFHYDNNTLIQGRVYPQGNDGNLDLYKEFRGFVQKELTSMLGLETNSWVKSGRSANSFVNSYGVHYRDYAHYSDCNASYPKEKSDEMGAVNIGHTGICPYCGEEFVRSDELSHCACEDYN